jgi:SAM-dependent methyltransferase
MYLWTQDSIRFRIDAAEYTGYDAAIAARILPGLPKNACVCDAGCGLGYLSLALSTGCARVAAVDSSGEALDVLRENIARRRAANIDVYQDDLFSMRPEPRYDAMVFCFFGRAEETLRAVKRQCSGNAYLVKKNWRNHRFTMTETPLKGYTLSHTVRELSAMAVPFAQETFPVEMGQPFRSLEDAVLFFRTYRQQGEAEVSPEQVLALLRPNDSKKYPLFLPSYQQLGLITVRAEDIPERFGDMES